MRKLKRSSARFIMVFMTDATNHISGLPGLTLGISISKDGGEFSAISPSVVDRGNGWYAVHLTEGHTDTLGDLAIHVSSTGADPTDMVLLVEGGQLDVDTSIISKILRNKVVTDPSTGVMTIYDDDNTSVLYQGNIFEDVGALQRYRGKGAELRERLE